MAAQSLRIVLIGGRDWRKGEINDSAIPKESRTGVEFLAGGSTFSWTMKKATILEYENFPLMVQGILGGDGDRSRASEDDTWNIEQTGSEPGIERRLGLSGRHSEDQFKRWD